MRYRDHPASREVVSNLQKGGATTINFLAEIIRMQAPADLKSSEERDAAPEALRAVPGISPAALRLAPHRWVRANRRQRTAPERPKRSKLSED
jgi:hypothetical protein